MTIAVRLPTHCRRIVILWLFFAGVLAAAEQTERKLFDLEGKLQPARRALITIYGVHNSYHHSAVIYWDGKFKFKKLPQGSYTLSVYLPRVGEFRQTQSVGPGSADSRGRVRITFLLNAQRLAHPITPKERFTIPVTKLAISDKAKREYFNAQKAGRKGDRAKAIAHLEKAVELAPQFSAAWNNLGTIAYTERRFEDAESYFREAHRQDPQAFEPIVNLGGVLISRNQFDEAQRWNEEAVKLRPRDALAQSQLGMTYFALSQLDLAQKHLAEARRLDPAHFSHPQLILSEIHIRRGQTRAAAAELENFLRYNPDHPQAARLRDMLQKLRSQ